MIRLANFNGRLLHWSLGCCYRIIVVKLGLQRLGSFGGFLGCFISVFLAAL